MTSVTTVLICMCERCGYGRANHPETARKSWVAGVRPQLCQGCGSPYWDVPKKTRARIALRFKSCVDRISCAMGFPRVPLGPLIKRRRVATTQSAPTRRSRIGLTESSISCGQTFAE